MRNTLLQANAITKSFAGVRALRRVSFELLEGEVHALVGENGAGKSTLTKVITGAITPDSGTLTIRGQVIEHNSPKLSRHLGVEAIYQQPAIFPHLTVAENIGIALERNEATWKVNWSARQQRAKELVERLGTSIDPRRPAHTLSMAEQQIVEVAKAIGANAKIVLMDEPTALLTDREARNLFDLIKRITADGVGVVYISHRLEEIKEIAHRITVLRDGESIATKDANDVHRAELIQMMVGRSVSSIFPKRDVPMGNIALEVKRISNDAEGLHNISFEVRRGEIFGLAGLVGSGRSELARTIFGLAPINASIRVNGFDRVIASPNDAIANGIGYLPEDRRQHGVITDMAIVMNMSLANLHAVSNSGLIQRAKEDFLASRFVQDLAVKTSSINAAAGSLSGGNQQKVALARWLAIQPKVMILDEPTQGVDVGSKAAIHELIMQLAERGMAIVLISSELPEILGMSDRIGVMRAGTIVGILDRAEATQEKVMTLALGHAEQLHPTAELPC